MFADPRFAEAKAVCNADLTDVLIICIGRHLIASLAVGEETKVHGCGSLSRNVLTTVRKRPWDWSPESCERARVKRRPGLAGHEVPPARRPGLSARSPSR